MLGGANFAQACEQAQSQAHEDCTNHIGNSLRQWLDDGLLAALTLPAGGAG